MKTLGWIAAATLLAGCASILGIDDEFTVDDGDGGAGDAIAPPTGGIVFLQRAPRATFGTAFDQDSYAPGARLVLLRDGETTVICCDDLGAEFAAADISSFDVSPDATELVMSAKLSVATPYRLFALSLTTGGVDALPGTAGRAYYTPRFIDDADIVCVTDDVVEAGATQFVDELGAVSAQLAIVDRQTGELRLAPRHLGQRADPGVLPDGRLVFSQRDWLGDAATTSLMIANRDLTGLHEGFGKEGTWADGPVVRARTRLGGKLVAVALPRGGFTYDSGRLIEIDLADAEVNASAEVLTPDVPSDSGPSTAGRYHDVAPLDADTLLVSWSAGPVVEGAVPVPDFGIYELDLPSGELTLLHDDPTYWDLLPQPVALEQAPPLGPIGATQPDAEHLLIGSRDVRDSTMFTFGLGTVYGVRVIEGFGIDEGDGVSTFGVTGYPGAAALGVAPIQADNSWGAIVPANIPLRLQPVDQFGLALGGEDTWISGRPGESMFCGGCHEDRAAPAPFDPTALDGYQAPTDLRSDALRADRVTTSVLDLDQIVGVPWSAVQNVLDAKCGQCHDGSASAANPSVTITDKDSGQSYTITFDLRGVETLDLAAIGLGNFPMSYWSLLGNYAFARTDLVVTSPLPSYVIPGNAAGSPLIQKLNPMQQFPTQGAGRRFPGQGHDAEQGVNLTHEEMYLLVLMADLGGQMRSREDTQ